GTQVATPHGPRAVDALTEGDLVCAADGRVLKLRGVMSTTVSAARQKRNPDLRPIRIVAGALGGGTPKRDLLVSRQHRMVLKSAIARRMFGQPEVLVAAAKLLELSGVFVDGGLADVGYYHLVFDDHEIIVAEGAETESLLIGPGIMKALGAEALSELIALFPQALAGEVFAMPARPIPSQKRTKKLMARHRKNNQPIYAQAGKA
ncbi:Hint domain-containing protein, partial [Cognatishimia sp.]|uniref:Hint domain-containing protein n=1 Tax=Cognatishimia sp. TaxID=2211648 RepID=UPI003515EE29